MQIYLSVIRFSALIVGAHGCYGIFTLPCEQLDYDRKKKQQTNTKTRKNKQKTRSLSPDLPQRKIVYIYRTFDSQKVVLISIYWVYKYSIKRFTMLFCVCFLCPICTCSFLKFIYHIFPSIFSILTFGIDSMIVI